MTGNRMAYRNGTYIAFDGLGETDPTKSDFKYYAILQRWSAGKNFEFKYVDSHDKVYSVLDTSKLTTLQASIRRRLSNSKQMVVILSDETRKSGSLLSYEIEQAVDNYEIPLIIAHTGYDGIHSGTALSTRWPIALMNRINNGTARAIHIPFKQAAILDAIGQFSIHDNPLTQSTHCYSRKAQIDMGCIDN
jgi:antiphage defense system Thoeris ThsB-like protein